MGSRTQTKTERSCSFAVRTWQRRGGAGREPVKAEPWVGRAVGGRGLRLGRGRGLAGAATEEEILNWVGVELEGAHPWGKSVGHLPDSCPAIAGELYDLDASSLQLKVLQYVSPCSPLLCFSRDGSPLEPSISVQIQMSCPSSLLHLPAEPQKGRGWGVGISQMRGQPLAVSLPLSCNRRPRHPAAASYWYPRTISSSPVR